MLKSIFVDYIAICILSYVMILFDGIHVPLDIVLFISFTLLTLLYAVEGIFSDKMEMYESQKIDRRLKNYL